MTIDWESQLGMTPEEKLRADLSASQKLAIAPDETESVNVNLSEMASLAEESLDFLAGLAAPEMYRFAFPVFYLAIWQLVKEELVKSRNFFQLALGIPRGFAKTTFVKFFILYVILFSNKRFILIVGRTSQLAENILADVVDMLKEQNIKGVFGWYASFIETDRNDLKKFTFRGRPIILAAVGVGGSVRGLNLKHERPEVIIMDDIQDKDDAKSQVVSEGIEDWMYGTLMKTKSPRGCMYMFLANMYPTPYSILKKIKTNPTWTKIISGGILVDGTSLWEDLRPVKDLIEEFNRDIAAGHPEIFCSEVLNDTESGINTRTDLSAIKPWPWTEKDLPQGRFILIDPSSNKTGGDDVAIGRFDVFDAKPGLRELVEEKLSPGDTIKRALLMALESNTRCIVAESNGYQSTLLYWFNFLAQQLGITGFYFLEVYSGMNSKNSRITETLKSLTSNEIALHPDVRTRVIHQISNWSPLRRNNKDNVLDLLSYAYKVLELYSAEIMTDTNFEMLAGVNPGVEENNHAF